MISQKKFFNLPVHKSYAASGFSLILAIIIFGTLLLAAMHVPCFSSGKQPEDQALRNHQESNVDEWSDIITWESTTDGQKVRPFHASLLPSGDILFIGTVGYLDANVGEDPFTFTMTPTPADQLQPETIVVTDHAIPYDTFGNEERPLDSISCSGHTLLADGTLFTVGGQVFYPEGEENQPPEPHHRLNIVALSYAMTYDGLQWTRIPEDMIGQGPLGDAKRWYPTAIRLPNANILVIGGFEIINDDELFPNTSAEVYDPIRSSWSLISPGGDTQKDIVVGPEGYSHVFQLPALVANSDVLIFGKSGVPVFLSTKSGTWTVRHDAPMSKGQDNPNVNDDTSSALLPIRIIDGEWGYHNGSILIAGSSHGRSLSRGIDVYDPVKNDWFPTIDMGVTRQYPSVVLLPNGQVLIVGGNGVSGHKFDKNPGLGRVQTIDPADGFSLRLGTAEAPEVRGHHHVALLLPDGRVLVGSGTDGHYQIGDNVEKSTFRYYSPPYMFQRRPQLNRFPSTIRYDSTFEVLWSGDSLDEAVLMGLGSQTHSFDMNQRYVQLKIQSQGEKTALISGPPNARIAPPGYYMLFLLDENRVPSVGKIILLQ